MCRTFSIKNILYHAFISNLISINLSLFDFNSVITNVSEQIVQGLITRANKTSSSLVNFDSLARSRQTRSDQNGISCSHLSPKSFSLRRLSLSSTTKSSVFFLRASTRLLTACDRTMYKIIEETMNDEFHAVSGLSRCDDCSFKSKISRLTTEERWLSNLL